MCFFFHHPLWHSINIPLKPACEQVRTMQGPSESRRQPFGTQSSGGWIIWEALVSGMDRKWDMYAMSHLHLFHPAWLRGCLAELHIKANWQATLPSPKYRLLTRPEAFYQAQWYLANMAIGVWICLLPRWWRYFGRWWKLGEVGPSR